MASSYQSSATSQQASGPSIFWALTTLALSAMAQFSPTGRIGLGDAFASSIWPHLVSPIFCCLDTAIIVQAWWIQKTDPSRRPRQAAQDASVAEDDSEDEPKHGVHSDSTGFIMRLLFFILAVLPQAVKLFCTTGIPYTQVMAACLFLPSLIWVLSLGSTEPRAWKWSDHSWELANDTEDFDHRVERAFTCFATYFLAYGSFSILEPVWSKVSDFALQLNRPGYLSDTALTMTLIAEATTLWILLFEVVVRPFGFQRFPKIFQFLPRPLDHAMLWLVCQASYVALAPLTEVAGDQENVEHLQLSTSKHLLSIWILCLALVILLRRCASLIGWLIKCVKRLYQPNARLLLPVTQSPAPHVAENNPANVQETIASSSSPQRGRSIRRAARGGTPTPRSPHDQSPRPPPSSKLQPIHFFLALLRTIWSDDVSLPAPVASLLNDMPDNLPPLSMYGFLKQRTTNEFEKLLATALVTLVMVVRYIKQLKRDIWVAYVLTHLLIAVLYYFFVFDGTGTHSPQWTSMLG